MFLLSMRAAIAVPIAWLSPEPSGPLVVSSPGSDVLCGCPWSRVPSLRSVLSSSTGKYPASASVA